MPKTSETPEEPQQGPPPIEEGPKQRPTRAESTPGGVGAPLGTETYEVQPLPALDAILQTNFMEDLEVKGLTSLLSHAETHMAGGYDEVHSLDTLSVYDFILMRAGHEDDQGVRRQDEITAPSVPKTIVPQGGGYVEKDAPLVRLESDESTDPQRVRVDLAPVQGSTASAAFLNFSSDQSVDAKHAEMGFYGLVSVAAGVAGAFYLYTYAGSIHSATPHNHAIWVNPYNHEIELPNHSNGFRIANVTDPILAQDAATKAYVDALSYAGHTLLDASLHTDTLAAGVTDGSIVIGNVTPKWSELVISIPAADVRNVLGVDNGELRPSWKAALDATNPVNAGGAAAPGTSLIFSHQDHVHAVAASHSGSAHHAALTVGADVAHSLAAQVLSAVLAANGQTGHMSGAMFDKLAAIEALADVTDAANVATAGAVMDSDISPGEGFLRKTGAGTYTAHKSNLAAAAAPGVNNDAAAGYSVGSIWVDTTNDNMYICVDATNGAAVWLHLNAAAAAHDHTGAADGGVLTNDQHDGYSEYAEIAIPSAPAASKGRLFTPLLTTNDSLTPGTDETGLYYRRPDGLMVKLNDDFPYSSKMRRPYVAIAPFGDPDEPPLGNSWVNLAATHNVASFTKDFLGCVWVQGLIKSGTVGATAFTMPEGHWNTGGHIRWAGISNGAFGILDLRTDGQVYPAVGSNAYFSLSHVAFPDVNRITWHAVGGGGEPAFENSWANYGAGWDAANFAKDALGRVWIKGMVKDGTPTTVFTLPAGYRPAKDILMVTATQNNLIGRLNILADGSVDVALLGAGANNWATISIVFMADGAATWREVGSGGGEPAFKNNWVNFGGAWDTCAFYKDAAGIVHIKGLVKGGTVGVAVFTLPAGYRPKQTINFPALSNDAIGVMAIAEEGGVYAIAGNNAWFSIHCSFIGEQ